MPFTGGFHPNVIIFAVEILRAIDARISIARPIVRCSVIRLRLTKLRMEIKRVCRQGVRERTIVEVVVKRLDLSLPLIRNRNQRVLLKRHWEKAVERFLTRDRQKLRLPRVIFAQPKPKKIAQWSLDGRRRLTVP